MKHDLSHEKQQNDAIRALARAIAGLASEMGKSNYKAICEHVEELLTADEVAVEDVPAEAPVVVTKPSKHPSSFPTGKHGHGHGDE